MSVMQQKILDRAQREAFKYFDEEERGELALFPDTTRGGSPLSIAAVGFGLSVYPVAVERGFVARQRAIEVTLRALRFFAGSEQSEAADATGFRGFYYHFLHPDTGRRQWNCELSVIDTALLMGGVLTAASYFDWDDPAEDEIRRLARMLYERVDWRWAQGGRDALSHGWRPDAGFLHYDWDGYSEALLLYALALGSPTHPLERSHYEAWALTYQWEHLLGETALYAGPLFIHQFSHAWIDFRGIRDAFMREKDCDYFVNSRRAVYQQRAYALRNPENFVGYGANGWGLSAGEGPGFFKTCVGREEREFQGYTARGIPYGPDDGTLAPAAVLCSLPFAPELVLPALEELTKRYPSLWGRYGLKGTFNPTLADETTGEPWIVEPYYGLDTGLIVMMVENQRSGLCWELVKRSRPVADGLRAAGFRGGWLDKARS
jgi:hypothetical protein